MWATTIVRLIQEMLFLRSMVCVEWKRSERARGASSHTQLLRWSTGQQRELGSQLLVWKERYSGGLGLYCRRTTSFFLSMGVFTCRNMATSHTSVQVPLTFVFTWFLMTAFLKLLSTTFEHLPGKEMMLLVRVVCPNCKHWSLFI